MKAPHLQWTQVVKMLVNVSFLTDYSNVEGVPEPHGPE